MTTSWEQIEQLVATRDVSEGFYPGFLRAVTEATDAVAALAWNCSENPYRVVSQYQAEAGDEIRIGYSQEDHNKLLATAAQQGRPILVSPDDSPLDANRVSMIAFVPLRYGESNELIEVFLKPDQTHQENKKTLELLGRHCLMSAGPASRSDPSETAMPASGRSQSALVPVPISAESLSGYIEEIHGSLELKETCSRVANETQALSQCDRVTALRFDGKRSKALAISGQPSVNRRANEVRLLERLATAVLRTGTPFRYPGDDAELLPQIEQPLNEYLVQGVTRSLFVLPVTDRPEPSIESVNPNEPAADRKVIAGIVIEHFTSEISPQYLHTTIELVTPHASTAIRNAVAHRSLFLYSMWHYLGKLKVVTAMRNLPKTLLVLAAIALMTIILVFVPADFTVSGPGKLVPQNRSRIYNLEEGVISRVAVRHGDVVEKEQLLVQLESNDLELEYEKVNGQIETIEKQVQTLDSGRLRGGNDAARQATGDSIEIQRVSLVNQLANLKRQKTVLQQRRDSLRVVSPMAGQVITWNVDERLRNRPVRIGRNLMEIAEVGGPWVVELKLPDRRVGHLLRAQENGKPLETTFVLAADPSRRISGMVVEIEKATRVDDEQGHFVTVIIEFEWQELEVRQVNTDVQAKIVCGRRSLGYVWLHDISEFVQKNVLFRIW